MNTLAKHLIKDFANKDYAHAYMDAHVNAMIAAQIKVLREQNDLTQEQLAELAGMKQERVSSLENVDYDSWTIKTLRKLAKAFDVHLQVRFAPFSQGVLDVANLSVNQLKVVPRQKDLTQFSQHMLVNLDGAWQALDTSALPPIAAKVVRGPIAPSSEWQRLDCVVR